MWHRMHATNLQIGPTSTTESGCEPRRNITMLLPQPGRPGMRTVATHRTELIRGLKCDCSEGDVTAAAAGAQ